MKLIRFLYFLSCLLSFCGLSAQLEITSGASAPFTPENLVENVFLGSGVEVTSVTADGSAKAVGFFSGGIAEIGLERGVVLSTSTVNSIDNLNAGTSESLLGEDITNGGVSDDELSEIASGPLGDVFSYTISFIPASDTLRFRYVFASEEYPEYNCREFNDIFGFFISGSNPNGGQYTSENIALVPDLSDPTGLTFTDIPVAINNIHEGESGECPASFPEYYNTNPVGAEHFRYNGYTSVFVAEAIVVPCEEYTIKLAIADVGDKLLGSCVFLEAKSFGTGTLDVSLNSLSADGSLAEGCTTGELEFVLPETVDQDYIIDIDFLSLPNSATSGIDYTALPSQLIIPAGSRSVSVELEAISDDLSEMDEVIAFEIQVDICNRKEFQIIIRDNELIKPLLPSDTSICDSETFLIDSELDADFELPANPYFENRSTTPITPEMEPVFSNIEVTGVVPTMLTPDVIQSVCIIGLEHRDLTDLDIFLISPGGQFLELSTDNGFKANNISDVDRFENTCFVPSAITNINNGNNLAGTFFGGNPTYSGDFLPEGVWSDLWDSPNPTNGTWRLLVIDDTNGFEGQLEGWSMTFRSAYNLTYEWSSDPITALCENCEDILVSPNVDTEYTLKITDSYGCEQSESINITVSPSLAAPDVRCGAITDNAIEVIWDEVSGNQGYEIRLDGESWILIPGGERFNLTGLLSNTAYELELRTVGPNCKSNIAALECRTDDCAKPTVSFSVDKEVTCPGDNDGVVTLAAAGVAPFTFRLGGNQNTTGVFTSVSEGANIFVVADATGCLDSVEVLMPGPGAFVLIPEYQLSEPCNVISDITGSFNITGGTPPYSYRWSNLTTSEEASDLSPATYFMTVTDSRNCEAVGELVIPNLESFIYGIETEPPLCAGESNGTATIVEVSGVGPYTYLWEDGSTEMINDNLQAGFYVVTVTDALGCETPNTFTVEPRAGIEIIISTEIVSCSGVKDGGASVAVTGGVSPYRFFWDGALSNSADLEGLAVGEYTLVVVDENDCSASQTFEITEPTGIAYVVGLEENVCFQGSEGEVQINQPISPNGPVTILWDNGSTAFERTGLPNGEYCFTLNDGSTCELNSCVTVGSPPSFLVTESVTNAKCENSTDGRVDLVVTGGVSPYSFTWNGPTADIPNEGSIVDLEAGEYSVTISDANFCEIIRSYNVEQATSIAVSQTVFPIDCKGDSTGQIFFSASGGQPPILYNWVGPSGFTATTNNIMGVPAGQYVVTYEDQSGCGGSQEFFISEPSLPLTTNISRTDTICVNSVNGELTVAPSGGTPPYVIMWSNGLAGMQNTGLAAGNYQVTVQDSKGCEVRATSAVYENDEVNIALDQSPSSCFQTNDGSAIITGISYGSDPANLSDFEISWNTSPIQTTVEARNLMGGRTYTVLVTDPFGCVSQQNIDIESPEMVSAEIFSFNNVSCFNGQDGSLEIAGTGGSSPYTYEWDINAFASTSKQLDGLRKGEYAVTITDDNGCTGFNRFSIEEPRPLSADFRIIDVSCFGGDNGRAEVLARGGVGPYSYLWTNNSTEMAIADVVSEQYNITVTDANGCTFVDSTKVEEPENGVKIDWVVNDVSCYEGRNGSINVRASGGSGFYSHSIDGEQYTSAKTFSNLEAGSYTIYAKDFKGCADTFPGVNVNEPEELVVDLGEDLIIPFGTSVTLSPVISGVGNYSFVWQSGNLELLSCNGCLNPVFDGQREASFELLVTDEMGCMASDILNIRLENFSPMFVPTAFTPNGDNENDVLQVFGAGIQAVETFNIYDRWGALVFEGKDLDIGDELLEWDGTFNGIESPVGLYYWFAEVTFDTGFQETFRGETTLLR